MPAPLLSAKLAVARGAGALSRLAGHGGTSIPGKVLMRLAPDAIGVLAGRLADGSAVVSATNGKTTTAAMAAGVLERRGARLIHNRAGANMAGGVAAALLYGRGEQGLFEVDELWLDQVVSEVRPRALLLGNLFRDQLDRYGELETIADRWQQVVDDLDPAAALVLCADDPLVADLGRHRRGTTFFGVEDDAMALAEMQHAADSKHCRRCGAAYVYDAIYLGHLGHYHCEACGALRPTPQVIGRGIALDGIRGARFTLVVPGGEAPVALPLPGLYNVYNALGAAALTHALGVPLDEIVAGLEAAAPAFGRAETVALGPPAPRPMAILLIKNPAGANEVLRTLILEEGEHDLLVVLNDNIADGRDVSWVWDADFEVLAPRVRRVTCAGTRAEELGVRLKYAGVPADRIAIVPGLEAALDAAASDGAAGPSTLYALPTYTAMLELRGILDRRGVADGVFG